MEVTTGITLEDIARELNISATTVSRSLRHDALINPETRARVNEVADRMGYKARVRRPRRVVDTPQARTLGLLMRHNSLETVRHDANLTQMMTGIMSVLDSSGVQLQMHTIRIEEHRHMADDPSIIPPMAQPGVCQAFIVHGAHDERDVRFMAGRAPVVSMGRIFHDLPIDGVEAGNTLGVCSAVKHLVELGHRKLAWVDNNIRSTFMDARQAGFVQGCLHHGLEVNSGLFFSRDIYLEENIHAENGILAVLKTGVTAFVCGSDSVANRMLHILELVGRRVPEDYSVTGFDAISSPYFQKRFTSVDPHFLEIGQAAAQLAIGRMAQPLARNCIVSVHSDLVIGESTAPPNHRK